MYSIIQAPNEILRTLAKPVDLKMPGLAKIITEMKKILVSQSDPEGVGLAANQIGLPYRLFVTRTGVFINPEILEHSEELQPEEKKSPLEGCLSLPKYYGVVKRWKWVKLQYKTISNHPTPMNTNLQSTKNKKLAIGNWPLEIGVGIWIIDCIDVFSGFPTVVIQHEMDHLDGKIFVERILEQQGSLYRVTGKNKKGKEQWEEVEI